MNTSSAENTLPRGKSTWPILAVVAMVLIGIGVVLGAIRLFDGRSGGTVPALDDGGRFVFVPSRAVPEVTVIDTKSDQIVARIAVHGIPSQVLVSDAAGVLAVSFADQSKLAVIALSEPGNKTEVAEVDLTITPEFMVLSPDGYLVAAADGTRGAVAVVSLQNRRRLFHLAGLGNPRNLTFSLDGSQLYIVDGKAMELVVIDIVQESIVERVRLEAGAAGNQRQAGISSASSLTRTPDGRYGFVSFHEMDFVIILDLRMLKPVRRLQVGRGPLRPYGTSDGRLMLVPNDGDRSVSVIDTTTLEVVATLPGAQDVTAINTGWFESLAFVMSRSQKRVIVLDLMKFNKVGEIDLPGAPGAGVVNSTGQKLYVTLGDTDQAAVIDTQTYKVLTLVNGMGRQPWGAIMARSNNYCH